MYRFQPDIDMHAYPIDDYPCKCKSAAAIMLMIMNNLDKKVAQFPDELITYGGNGQVFSNWAQVNRFENLKKRKDLEMFYSFYWLCII
jgi:urocanate hydratase